MSDLQVALITLGAFIIAGVVVYNWMQERKMRKNITDDFLVPQKDVLAEDFYIDTDAYVDKEFADIPNKAKLTERLNEPDLTSMPAMAADEISEQDEALQDETTDEELIKEAHIIAGLPPMKNVAPAQEQEIKQEPNEVLGRSIQRQAKSLEIPAEDSANTFETEGSASTLPNEIHPQIDLTAFLYVTKNINAQPLNTMANAIADDMGVPMMVHGMDKGGKWYMVNQNTPNESFKQVACSIQLADRGGPISKHMLNKFQFSIENMGLEIGAHVEWQGSGDAMQRAIGLDKFCMEVDQLVSVHLVQGEAPVHGTKFRGLAESSGMRLGEDGKFYYYSSSHPDAPQFILVNSDSQPFTSDSLRNTVVKGATFQLEIPKVANCDQVFSQMVQIAQKMANSLGARMVDDNQKPLGDLQIEKIRQQLKIIHATMVARGVMPGSVSSARLFN